ncbi:MAG: glycosyltransferase [Lentisphaerae bacterium]|nr:glycosyltransferase [Lentisphaerota bacterium]
MRISQILAGFGDGDATSHEALLLRDVFRRWGCESDIFVDPARVSPGLRGTCRPLEAHADAIGDICLHHYGIADPAADVFLRARGRRILVYHNITPSKFFRGYDDAVAARLEEARRALPDIAGKADAVWTVSRFNAMELEAMGIAGVRVFPLLFAPRALDLPHKPLMPEPLKTILFVGRIAPNKRVEDLILAFAHYHKCVNPFSRLVIVGSDRSAPRYYTMLRILAGDLDLPNVCFEGFAAADGLVAYYERADVYVCPSAHEGYCLPLLEAMYKRVPVIARAVGGMPEAMDGAGVLYDDLSPAELAELIHLVLSDTALRGDIVRSQEERVRRALNRDPDRELRELLGEWINVGER